MAVSDSFRAGFFIGKANSSVLFWSLAPLASHYLADTIVLVNGDRVTGYTRGADAGKVVIDTAYAGEVREVRIDWTRIGGLTSDEPMTVLLDDRTRPYGRLAGDDNASRVISPGGLLERTVEVKHVDAILQGHVLEDRLALSGRLDIGACQTSGNTQTSAAPGLSAPTAPLGNRFRARPLRADNVDWNSHPPPGFESMDRMLLVTVGYHW